MTLEAVAAAAGVSKGGLLYHFPTKEALLSALVDSACREFNQAIDKGQTSGLDWMHAYLEAALAPGEFDSLGPALQGVISENPALLAPARKHFQAWYSQAYQQGGLPAQLALLVLDGLFLHQQLGIDVGLDMGSIRQALPALWSGC